MKKFAVNINGRQYIVEVEELTSEAANIEGDTSKHTDSASLMKKALTQPDKQQPASMPQPIESAPAPVAPPTQGSTEGYAVKAPLRGQIMRIAVKPGDNVKRGQVLCSIEALKLENEITSPVSGVVTGVFVQAGANVDTGAVLVTIKE